MFVVSGGPMFGRRRHRTHETLDQLVRGQQAILAGIARLGAQMSQMDDEITQLVADVAAERNLIDKATALISGFPAAIQKAVDDALAAGATPQQLQTLTDLHAAIGQQSTDLTNAIATNTPPAAPAPTP
jgi:hypothetical protein